jgi:ElaB/YqjD/DUF883 family membrane-anchored ribosome-binding protein
MTEATTTTTPQQDPAEIERDIRRTQDEMSRTVDQIGDQLNPRTFINALLDKAEDNNIDARYLIDGARRNPLALAMISGGLIWLVSDSDAKLPSFGSKSSSGIGSDTGTTSTSSFASEYDDPYHRDYLSHMERIQRDAEEDDLAYQRRRDLARANYFMVERGHEEDESSWRQRLDQATETFRNKRRAWADSTRHAGSSARDTAQQAASSARDTAQQAANSARDGAQRTARRAQQAYTSNPLIGGLIAAAVGAIAGTALPLTRTEGQKLAGLGETTRDALGEKKDQLISATREKKDELLSKVEEAGQTGSTGQGGTQAGTGGSQIADGERSL